MLIVNNIENNITWLIPFTLTITRIPSIPLLHTPLSINSLHLHQHLSLFQCRLLWQTIASNLHIHLHVSCHFIMPCFISSQHTGLSLLILIISGYALHAWLVIEIQLNECTFVKLDKTVNPAKNTFLIKTNILYYIILFHQIIVNIFNVINWNRIIINTKIINITSKSCSVHIIYGPIFWNVS